MTWLCCDEQNKDQHCITLQNSIVERFSYLYRTCILFVRSKFCRFRFLTDLDEQISESTFHEFFVEFCQRVNVKFCSDKLTCFQIEYNSSDLLELTWVCMHLYFNFYPPPLWVDLAEKHRSGGAHLEASSGVRVRHRFVRVPRAVFMPGGEGRGVRCR